MTRTCSCGQPVTSRYGRLCPACLFSARSKAGKMMKQAVRERKRKPPNVVAVLARCPATLHDWIAMLPPSMVEPGKLPRIYCQQHENRRSISEAYTYRRAT